jgi:hypothetical protein
MPEDRSRIAGLILDRLNELDERVSLIEMRLLEIDEAVDSLDRYNRPYGDGTRLPVTRRRD